MDGPLPQEVQLRYLHWTTPAVHADSGPKQNVFSQTLERPRNELENLQAGLVRVVG